MKKMQAIHFIYNKGLSIEQLKKTADTDSIGITVDIFKDSETFGKYLVVVQSKDYEMSRELFNEPQIEGSYCYSFII